MSKPIKLSPQVAEETSAQRPVNQTRAFEVLKKKASELDGRLSQAELSITPEAITAIVGDYAYSKGEIDLSLSNYSTITQTATEISTYVGGYTYNKSNIDTKDSDTLNSANSATDTKLLNYSTITQTADSIALEIGKVIIGTRNYLKNSTFANGFTNWSTFGAGISVDSTTGVSDGNSAKIVGSLGVTNYILQSFAPVPVFTPGSKLAISCKVKVDSVVYGTTNPFVRLYPVLEYTDLSLEYPPTFYVAEGTRDWYTISIIVTTSATKTIKSVRVHGYGRDFTGTVWFDDFKCEVGTKVTEWSPADGELFGAKYVFDSTNATFTGGGLIIKNNAGTTVFTADVNGDLEITGKITSTSGQVGGWDITATSLQTGAYNTSGTRYFGSSGLSISNTFRVTSAGALTATSGSIGGWNLSSTAITSPSGALKLDATNNRLYINTSAYMSANATSTTIDVTGSLNVSSGITANGTIQGNQFSTQAIVPRANETYTIGTSSFRFSGAYINTLYMKFGTTYYTITRDANGFLKAV